MVVCGFVCLPQAQVHVQRLSVDALSSQLIFLQYYDYPHDVYQAAIVDSANNGTLDLAILDSRVADMLRVKLELGLFDAPYTNTSKFASVTGNSCWHSLLTVNFIAYVAFVSGSESRPNNVPSVQHVLWITTLSTGVCSSDRYRCQHTAPSRPGSASSP